MMSTSRVGPRYHFAVIDVPESHCTLLSAAARHPQAWRNGGGITYEIARGAVPDDPQRFAWRVSIAHVDRDGPFSSFAGYERSIGLIEGQGMELHGLTGEPVVLRPFEVLAFSGSTAVNGRLTSGPVKDFNLIFDPHRCRASLRFIAGHHGSNVREAVVVNLAHQPLQWWCGQQRGALALLDAVHITSEDTQPLSLEAQRGALVTIDAA